VAAALAGFVESDRLKAVLLHVDARPRLVVRADRRGRPSAIRGVAMGIRGRSEYVIKLVQSRGHVS
jgi:hypothetical protein